MSKSKKQNAKTSASKSASKAAGKADGKTSLKAAGTSTSKTSLKPASRKAVAAAPLKAGATGKKTNSTNNPLTPEITITLNHDQIAKRAFDIWVAKGRPTGQDEQNWREAEQALARDLAKRA